MICLQELFLNNSYDYFERKNKKEIYKSYLCDNEYEQIRKTVSNSEYYSLNFAYILIETINFYFFGILLIKLILSFPK